MKILKPPRLRRGDVIGLISPASAPLPAEKIEKGVRYLERLGYRVHAPFIEGPAVRRSTWDRILGRVR